jgi:hypothetical protein
VKHIHQAWFVNPQPCDVIPGCAICRVPLYG